MYSDSILFQTLRLLKTAFRAFLLIVLTIMICFFNDFGWLVGLGSNGYLGRKNDFEKYYGDSSGVAVDFRSIGYHSGFDGYVGAMDLCGTPTDLVGGPVYADDTTRMHASFNSLLDNNFYTRSHTSVERKIARINRAVVTASVAAVRLRVVIARLKQVQPAGYADDDNRYCGGYDPQKQYDIHSGDAAANVKLNHAPIVTLRHGVACLASYNGEGGCYPKATFYADLFSVSLAPEQEEAEAAMLNMGTEEFWLTAAHENGVHNDAAIRESVQAYHRILNARHPHFDDGGVQDTRSATFMQIVGLQNFE